jgi:predicted kinase
MAKLTALIGLARSGKSTFAKKWQTTPDPDGLSRVVVNGDNVRLALHGMRYVHSAEPIVHGIYNTMVKALLLNPDLSLLMDDTHTTVGSIRAVLNMDVEARFIYIDTPLGECQSRAISTGQRDLLPVISRMWDNLQDLKCYHSRKNNSIILPSDSLQTLINRSIEQIRSEVRMIKEYSDRSV